MEAWLMRRLPPLGGLEAFLHVARLGSLKAAAAEMALSTPALSRRIQALERHVGGPLFSRDSHAMRLNDTGQRLHTALAPALDALRDVLELSLASEDDLRLRLNVLPLFAQQRLFPRLPELRARHPRLHLDIETAGHGETRLGDGLDAAITLARDVDPALHAVRLDRDLVYPIAARKFADGPDKISVPEQLQRQTVLLHSEMPETFAAWRDAIGMPWLEPAAVDQFDSGQLMLEAAAQGVGIAFMHAHHLTDANDPRLVRLFNFEIESPYSYWFLCRPRALRRPAVKLFHDWLVGAGI
jgi:LysR family transcriptional regulator, glycine cleavage system transcriptional activator